MKIHVLAVNNQDHSRRTESLKISQAEGPRATRYSIYQGILALGGGSTTVRNIPRRIGEPYPLAILAPYTFR